MKGMLVLVAGAVVGNYVAERFLLKAGPDDPTGFIPVADGIGLDDLARAVAIVATTSLLKKFLGG